MAILRNVIAALLVVFSTVGGVSAETIPATQTSTAPTTVYNFKPESGGTASANVATLEAAASAASGASASCTTMLGYEGCSYTGSPGLCANMAAALTTGAVLCRNATRIPDGAALKVGIGVTSSNRFILQSTTGCVSPATLSGGQCVTLTCPAGFTLSGNQCTAPDCVAPSVRQPDGSCASPCEAAAQQPATYAWLKSKVGGPSVEGTYCNGQCMVGVNPAPTGTAYNNGVDKIQRYQMVVTAAPCQSANMPVPDNGAVAPPEPPKKPVCAANEGVLTTTSGTIACVPPGVPTQSTPIVTKKSETQNFPDGSTKTISTTYTKDPVSGVQDTQQTTVTTGASGGGAGQAGPVGTSSTSGSSGTTSGGNPDPTKGDGGDLCRNNPTLDICTGKLNKEETQLQIKEGIKSLTDPGSTPYTALENAKQSAQADADLKTQTDKFEAIMAGTVDPAASSKSSWQSAMESGWFSPIPATTCSPYTATIGGRTWTLDLCPIAEKISVIAEYAMWFGLVVGVFVMFTGGAYVRNQ